MKTVLIIRGLSLLHYRLQYPFDCAQVDKRLNEIGGKDFGSGFKVEYLSNRRDDIYDSSQLYKTITNIIDNKNISTVIMPDLSGVGGDGILVQRLRIERPDIFLCAISVYHTPAAAGRYYPAINAMKIIKYNLHLSISADLEYGDDCVFTPEETSYTDADCDYDFSDIFYELIYRRHNLTYHRTNLVHGRNTPFDEAPWCFKEVVAYVANNGGFISDNGLGFTPGHFSYRAIDGNYLVSQRKMNHRLVMENGFTLVASNDTVSESGVVTAVGSAKPSVGFTSQKLLFDQYPEYDCIIHTHNPKRQLSLMPTAPQKGYQCGSLQCGQNTVDNLAVMGDGIGAVYLEKHGPNIAFNSSLDPNIVIKFITDNIILGKKVQ